MLNNGIDQSVGLDTTYDRSHRCPLVWRTQETNVGIESEGERVANCATSTFGSGFITFTIPVLFRTPKGINLRLTGPSNWIKDGVQPLDGIVETDWSA